MRVLIIFCLMLALISSSSAADRVEQLLQHLPYVVEEVDRTIAKEFLRQEGSGRAPEELLADFAAFKKVWVDRMIEFLIKELDINEEGASEARKNPDAFYINYDTYKLFVTPSI